MATCRENAEIMYDLCPTIIAGREQPIVAYESEDPNKKFTVRRVTPTECARLQGFPDSWGYPDTKCDMTDEELNFWIDVRNTDAKIKDKKPYNAKDRQTTKKEMINWYNKLHSNSKEYKMWGNGIALPCASFILGNIAKRETNDTEEYCGT